MSQSRNNQTGSKNSQEVVSQEVISQKVISHKIISQEVISQENNQPGNDTSDIRQQSWVIRNNQ